MGRDSELFKAAQNGNTEFLEKAFATFLASDKDTPPTRGRGKKQSSGVRYTLDPPRQTLYIKNTSIRDNFFSAILICTSE